MDMEQMWSARMSSTDLNGPEPRPTAPLRPAQSRFPQIRALVGHGQLMTQYENLDLVGRVGAGA
jgi:hypothetical protein